MNEEFNRIFELYHKDIFRLIYSFTLNKEDAKDILQETFLKFYKNINKISNEDIEIKRWLIKVASNKCKDNFKSFWKRNIIKTDMINDNNSVTNKEKELIDLLNNLKSQYRIPLYLYYYEGYKIEEISQILNEKISTIKMRLLRAKKILKEELEEK